MCVAVKDGRFLGTRSLAVPQGLTSGRVIGKMQIQEHVDVDLHDFFLTKCPNMHILSSNLLTPTGV